MKKLAGILVILAIAIACSRPQSEVQTAAMAIYERYAQHSATLDVAYIGNYEVEGHTFNAVWMQTPDSAEWEWLKREFGVFRLQDVPLSVVALPASAADPVLPPGAEQGAVMSSLFIDSTLQFETEEQYVAYIDSAVRELMKEVLGEESAAGINPIIIPVDSMPEEMFGQKLHNQADLANTARTHEQVGYIVSADYDNQTLWIFFYADEKAEASLLRALHQADAL